MRAASEQRWIERIERTLTLLAKRLDDPPSLRELARTAGSSPYHFHRIWRALMGETVSQTIARLRIAVAQERLRRDHATVTQVAMDGGFATPQSLGRAFRRVSGMTPTEFLTSGLEAAGVVPVSAAIVRIEVRPPCRLVALRREGGAYRELNSLFQRVWNWAQGAGLLDHLEGIYGIPLDDPLSVEEDALRYDACLALGDAVSPPEPFRTIELPAGEYALLSHRGSYDALEGANDALMQWLIASGRMPADFPMVHEFLDDPDVTPAEALRTHVLLRLEPVEMARC
jgi:AraC family transcriptional regulator